MLEQSAPNIAAMCLTDAGLVMTFDGALVVTFHSPAAGTDGYSTLFIVHM